MKRCECVEFVCCFRVARPNSLFSFFFNFNFLFTHRHRTPERNSLILAVVISPRTRMTATATANEQRPFYISTCLIHSASVLLMLDGMKHRVHQCQSMPIQMATFDSVQSVIITNTIHPNEFWLFVVALFFTYALRLSQSQRINLYFILISK